MYNPDIHHRRSIRLRNFDYSTAGAYFVTLCTQGHMCLFGDICNGEIKLNHAGHIVTELWSRLPERFPGIFLSEFTVMPNHFHAIIFITDPNIHEFNNGDIVGAPLAAPVFDVQKCSKGAASAKNQGAASAENQGAASAVNQGAASSAPTLGKIMRAFKSISAIEVNRELDRQGKPLWQRNYFERIIRDENEMANVSEYIIQNPMRWIDDKYNPDLNGM
ncbi:MAG TPA: hypothetical protein HPP94_08990 [Desulfuromonadales bacterium]|nr:hypothetical protein [Desulfuromonadales bacterium]